MTLTAEDLNDSELRRNSLAFQNPSLRFAYRSFPPRVFVDSQVTALLLLMRFAAPFQFGCSYCETRLQTNAESRPSWSDSVAVGMVLALPRSISWFR